MFTVNSKTYVEERTSKAGNKYFMLVVELPNGYKFESILNREQAYIFSLCKDK